MYVDQHEKALIQLQSINSLRYKLNTKDMPYLFIHAYIIMYICEYAFMYVITQKKLDSGCSGSSKYYVFALLVDIRNSLVTIKIFLKLCTYEEKSLKYRRVDLQGVHKKNCVFLLQPIPFM